MRLDSVALPNNARLSPVQSATIPMAQATERHGGRPANPAPASTPIHLERFPSPPAAMVTSPCCLILF